MPRMNLTGASGLRWACVVLLALWCVSVVGCRTAKPAAPAPPPKPGQVYFVTGMADVFSTGLMNMANRLKDQGYDAQWVSQSAWLDLLGKLRSAHHEGRLRPPLIIGGHSLGARHAIEIAAALQKEGVVVDTLVLLDAFLPPEIPGNVKLCIDVYKSTPILAPEGPRIYAADPTFTLVQMFDVRKGEVEGVTDSALMMHVNFTDFEPLQDWVVQRVRERLEAPAQ